MRKILFLLPVLFLFSFATVSATNNCHEHCGTPRPSSTPRPSTTPTPSATPSLTPEATITPTERPYVAPSSKEAEPAPNCKPISWAPTIAWVSRANGFEAIWSTVDDYTDQYWVEYKVGGITYTATTKTAYFFTEGNVESIRVAAMNNGCRGNFSQWSTESVQTGSK